MVAAPESSSSASSAPAASARLIGQTDAVLQHGDPRQKSEQRAGDCATAAEDRRAAEHHGGDGRQLVIRLPASALACPTCET